MPRSLFHIRSSHARILGDRLLLILWVPHLRRCRWRKRMEFGFLFSESEVEPMEGVWERVTLRE